MAENIVPFSISAPGFLGLNTQDAPVDIDKGFALQAVNCVIDKSGRVASRKGWAKANTSNVNLGTNTIQCIGEVIQADGTATTVAAGGGYLFKLSGTTLTTLTYGGGGAAPTISANRWQFCQLNGVGIFWQRGYDPLIYDPAVSTTTFRRLNEKSGSSGTVYKCNTATSAFGRIWAADTSTDKQTVVWSDLLTPHIWTGGTSGTLDLRNVWPLGGDEVVGLSAHNNFLYIFGRRQILIYSGAEDPATMKISDTIVGIGCIARDTIKQIGEDIWFLSDTGVRSLQRTIQEKSAPFRYISKNVHDDIQSFVDNETVEDIFAGYSAVNSFYLLHFPGVDQTFCFDTRQIMQDGSARATTWLNIAPECFCEVKNRTFYIGKSGYIGEYTGYLDDTVEYRMAYYTTWIDFGDPIRTSILKRIILNIIGGNNQTVVFKWAYDFIETYFSQSTQLSDLATEAEYNIAEFNTTAEYSANLVANVLQVPGSSAGRVLQFGFEAQINQKPISIQRIDIYTKEGRL